MTINRNTKMTDLECLEALFRREKPERVVYWEYYTIAIAAVRAGLTIEKVYADPVASYYSQKKMADELGLVFHPVWECLGGDFGAECDLSHSGYSQGPAITRHPIRSRDDLRRLEKLECTLLPEGVAFSRLASSEKTDNCLFDVTLNISGPFTKAGHLCGVDRLCRWIIEDPGLVHQILRMTTDYLIDGSRQWLEAFPSARNLLLVSEPIASNNIISPEHFKNFAWPYIREYQEAALNLGYRHIFCHICGNQNANLPYWAKIPMGNPGIISIGPEMDIETVAQYFPNDIIHGNLNPVLLQTGTPEDVYQAARRVVEQGQKIGGRFVFGQGCEIPPRAADENIRAMIRAVADYGWY